MATILTKPVSRELQRVRATKQGRIEIPDKTGFITAAARPVIITLLPSDELQWRVKGTVRKYRTSLSVLMMITQAITEVEFRQEKIARSKARKAIGKRTRRPKRVFNPHAASLLRRLLSNIAG